MDFHLRQLRCRAQLLDALGIRDNRLIKTSGFNDQTNWTTDGADYQELADGQRLLCGFDLKQNTALLVSAGRYSCSCSSAMPRAVRSSRCRRCGRQGLQSVRAALCRLRWHGVRTRNGWLLPLLLGGLKFIGDQEVDRTFLAMLISPTLCWCKGAIDPLRRVVRWRYKRSIDSSSTVSEVCHRL
jgi:hypothetical protein